LVVVAHAVEGTPRERRKKRKRAAHMRVRVRRSQRRLEGMLTMMRKSARPLVWESRAQVASGEVRRVS